MAFTDRPFLSAGLSCHCFPVNRLNSFLHGRLTFNSRSASRARNDHRVSAGAGGEEHSAKDQRGLNAPKTSDGGLSRVLGVKAGVVWDGLSSPCVSSGGSGVFTSTVLITAANCLHNPGPSLKCLIN